MRIEDAKYVGSKPKRQAAGLPGHCGRCVQVGHVKAHPALGCADVGCTAAHGGSGIRVEVTEVTPAMAAGWLATYEGVTDPAGLPVAANTTITIHAQDMQAGLWVVTGGNPVLVSPTGQLLKGRLRMLAVQESGQTVLMTVVYGATQEHLDMATHPRKRRYPR